MKKVAIKNKAAIPVHLPPNLQVLPSPPVYYSAESLADSQSGLSSISYSSRSDLEAFSTPSLARTVSSATSRDGVSITMSVFVFCLILHEVNISFSKDNFLVKPWKVKMGLKLSRQFLSG